MIWKYLRVLTYVLLLFYYRRNSRNPDPDLPFGVTLWTQRRSTVGKGRPERQVVKVAQTVAGVSLRCPGLVSEASLWVMPDCTRQRQRTFQQRDTVAFWLRHSAIGGGSSDMTHACAVFSPALPPLVGTMLLADFVPSYCLAVL